MTYLVHRDSDRVIDRWYIFNAITGQWKTKFVREERSPQLWRRVSGSTGALSYYSMLNYQAEVHKGSGDLEYVFTVHYTEDEYTDFIAHNFIKLL